MNIVKSLLPLWARSYARQLRKWFRYAWRYWRIRLASKLVSEMKIILGAAETAQEGWFSTNEQWLDITNEGDWKKIFGGRVLLSRAVAEHVFEHLSPQEAEAALRLIWQHMLPGGRIRIAVPDGYNPNPEYLRHVGIRGKGADAADHKQLLSLDSLSNLMRIAGFSPHPVEGFTQDGELIQKPYSIENGFILRSRANKMSKSAAQGWDFPDSKTSLIVDGVKT